MAKPNPQIAAHLEWLGFVRPTGLVVSAPALVRSGAILERRDKEGQRLLGECTAERRNSASGNVERYIPDFRAFAVQVLGWSFSPRGYAGADDAPHTAETWSPASRLGRSLGPTFAVRTGVGESQWQLLVQECKRGEDLDWAQPTKDGPDLSHHGRMERLLRQTGTTAGLLCNGTTLRLVSAPKGESSGWMDFGVADMSRSAGRPICTAMRLLLKESRLLTGPREKRLKGLLEESRKYQNEVSERLSEQVLHALYELLRGFQAAHDASPDGQLLGRFLKSRTGKKEDDPDEVYRGLLALLLRLIFLLYAEERDMLPQDDTFLGAYSLAGLHKRLTEDAALNPDTMDQRYGAYAQLLAVFRMVHDGARSGDMELPPRHGALFDPDRYRFLEGRTQQLAGGRQKHERIEPPLVSDGAIHRVLEKLLVLDGERISYRALDVEHIGSVYETMMGFRLEKAEGSSIAIKAAKKHGAPATIDIEALLVEPARKRAKWIRDRTDRKITDKTVKAVRAADTLDALHAALDSVVDKNATPDLVPAGAMILQPSEERRRSGSHYTPRELTAPIVRNTLKPVLDRLRSGEGGVLKPEQILDLKVCDPAMGSGAFLVEACRQLGTALVKSWHRPDADPPPPPPPDFAGEDELVFARREIARRCLYGVDRNPVAVDLAKLSLWLVTLAKDHPLTFLDHALRHGDSLVGLTRRQIGSFHWNKNAPALQLGFEADKAKDRLEEAAKLRRRIRHSGDSVLDWVLSDMWDEAKSHAREIKLLGDLVIAAFFEGAKPSEREEVRSVFADDVVKGQWHDYGPVLEELRHAEPPLAPFHWEIEFPEVFERKNPGFDAIVGNPPFAGKNSVAAANVAHYPLWLKELHQESHGNADLVAHFFRRSYNLLRSDGTFGLIATNSIGQGDTRSTGLCWICEHGGQIYRATTRVKWPGLAAVVVSVVYVGKDTYSGDRILDDNPAGKITAFLFHRGGNEDPVRLTANAGKSFVGSTVHGMGFTFDDTDKKGVASPLAEMQRLIAENSVNRSAVYPYIGGEEVNTSPTHAHHRYVINFHDYPLRREDLGESWAEADEERRWELRRHPVVPLDYPEPVAEDWPELLAIVEERVKPHRDIQNRRAYRERWWHYAEKRRGLYSAVAELDRVLGVSLVGQHATFAFLPRGQVYAVTLIVFPLDTYAAFCGLQCRVHEIWARFFGSSMKDDLRYTPSDVFQTFPFAEKWNTRPDLEAAGKQYYEFRAALMVRNDEGLTKTYNRFHDPNEHCPDIARLRDLHAVMDKAVLNAYGWTDIPTDCEFLLDYEIDEEEWGRKKKPYRYRWQNDIRDEVLARLLELNAERARAELRPTPPSFST